jgi:small subunit ribosomal protein S2e
LNICDTPTFFIIIILGQKTLLKMSETPATPAPTDGAPTEGAPRGRGGDRGRGFGGRGGDRGRGGRGGRGGGPGGGRGGPKEEWTPLTKLGRLVKNGYVKSLEEVYTHSIPIKEAPIVDRLLANDKAELSDEIMCILSVQKQTKAGQRTRFKAVVAIGDRKGHVGIGIKCAKEVQIAIKGALVDAKLNLIPVRRGYWGSRIGGVHTIPIKVKGKCGSCTVRMIPAPRGTGCVAAMVAKKILNFAGIDDVYTSCTGQTRTRENFCRALFEALKKTYAFLTPDLWPKTDFIASPFVSFWKELKDLEERKGRSGGDRGRGRGGRGGRGGDRGRGRGGPRGGRGGGRGGSRPRGGE